MSRLHPGVSELCAFKEHEVQRFDHHLVELTHESEEAHQAS